MSDFPPKEEYLEQLGKDIVEAKYRIYGAQEELDRARERFQTAERNLTNCQEHESDLRKLYFYAAGEEYDEWAN